MKPKEAVAFLNCRKEVSLTTDLLRVSGNTRQEHSPQLSARRAPSPLEKPQGSRRLFRFPSSNKMIPEWKWQKSADASTVTPRTESDTNWYEMYN